MPQSYTRLCYLNHENHNKFHSQTFSLPHIDLRSSYRQTEPQAMVLTQVVGRTCSNHIGKKIVLCTPPDQQSPARPRNPPHSRSHPFLRRRRIRISWVVDGRSERTTPPIQETRPHLCNRSDSLLFRVRRQECRSPRLSRCGAVVACSLDQVAHRVLHVTDTVVGNRAGKGVCEGGIVLAGAKFGVDMTTCTVSLHWRSRDINILGKEKNWFRGCSTEDLDEWGFGRVCTYANFSLS